MRSGPYMLFVVLLVVVAAGFAVTPHLVLAAPIPVDGGFIQKIFYYHVPVAWVSFLSVFVAGGGAIAFLARRSELGDQIAVAAAELAVLFGLLVLVTGPLWARQAWGRWWVWDARLTTLLLLWLIFVVFLLLRRYGGAGARAVSAGLAIFGMVDVPIIWVAVQLWRTQHPKTSYVPSLGAAAQVAFFTSLGLFTLLWLALFWLRLRQARQQAQLDEVYVTCAEAGLEEEG